MLESWQGKKPEMPRKLTLLRKIITIILLLIGLTSCENSQDSVIVTDNVGTMMDLEGIYKVESICKEYSDNKCQVTIIYVEIKSK